MYMTSQAIEEKLKKPDCSLNELLDEEEIIQEMKSGNAKLLNFFDKEKVKKLIEYIIVEPTEDEFKRGHRYPFMSSELLNCDVPKILEFFTMTEGQRLQKDRKSSNADSDLGNSDWNYSSKDWYDKKEDAEDKNKGEEIEKESNVNEALQDKTDFLAEPQEKDKQKDIADDACEVINVDATVDEKEFKEVGAQREIVEELEVKQTITTLEQTESTQIGLNSEDAGSSSIELLDYLLSFLDTDSELNHVLAGYFSKIMLLLLSKQQKIIVTYIYTRRPQLLDRFIQHIEMRSICDIFPKLIFSENTYNAEANFSSSIPDFDKTRNETITKLFKKLNLTMSVEAINNIVNACIELLENRSILEFLVTEKPILDHLFVNLSHNLNEPENSDLSAYNYKEILILLLNILKDSIIDNIKIPAMVKKNEESGEEEFQNSPIGESILENLPKILENFEIVETPNSLLDTTFGVSTRTIGITRIRIVEFVHLIFSYFKNCPNVLDRIMIESNFLKHGLDYLFEFEWNNQYQHDFTNLLKYLLGNAGNNANIVKHLFEDLKLLNFLMEHANERNFLFNSNRKINNGYFAYLIEISHKISTNSDEKITCYFNVEWKTFINEKVSSWLNMFNRKLCYEEKSNVFISSLESKLEEPSTGTQETTNEFATTEEKTTEDWFESISGKTEEKNINYDEMGGFDFTDDHHDEGDIEKYSDSLEKLNVDELDTGNFNDFSYWKFRPEGQVDNIVDCLRDLEL